MQKNDRSIDLIVAGIMDWRLPPDGDHEPTPSDALAPHIMARSHEVSKARKAMTSIDELPTLFGVPDRASRWMRDAHLRRLVSRMPGVIPWHRALAAKKEIDDFIDHRLDPWIAFLSTRGRKPPPLQRQRWVEDSSRKFGLSLLGESCEREIILRDASAQGLPLPTSARTIYQIHVAPLGAVMRSIEIGFPICF